MEAASSASFAELLRRHRLALGLTQEELADRAGLSPNAVSDLERSRRRAPYRATLEALESALDLTPEEQRALESSVVRRRRPLIKRSELPPRDVSTLLPEVVEFSASGGGARLRLELPLVGREKELTALLTDYELARQGEVRLAVLEGEAGIGKTRLAESFLRWAENSGSDVLRGAALETAAALPYHPIVDAIRVRLARDDRRQGLLPEAWLAELARLLPELNVYADLPEPARTAEGEGGPQARLFEAVVQLTLALMSPLNAGPLILFLDDVQWTDTASRDLLQYLLRRWQEEKAGVLLLLAVRTESTQEPDLMSWLINLWRSDSPSRIFLSPLNPSETVAALEWMAVAETLGSDASAPGGSLRLTDLAGWLQTRTAGHPLYLTEMVRALRDRGVIELRPDGGLEVTVGRDEIGGLQTILPATVRALIQSRLAGLDRRASDILVAIAVLGEEAGLELVLRVAALEETEAIQSIDLLAQRRVLVETEGPASAGIGHVGYRIAHDLIREVVYAEAGEARRRLFHRRSLTELEALRAPAAELLRHALAAPLPLQALRYAVAAGDDALAVFAPEDGIHRYETARHLLTEHGLRTVAEAVEDSAPDQPFVSTDELEHLLNQLARAYEWIGDWPRAKAAYHDLLAHARVTDSVELEAQCLVHLSWIVWAESADVAEASRFASEALEKLGASGNHRLRAEAYRQLAFASSLGSAPHEAKGHVVQAIELAHSTGATEIEAQAQARRGWVLLEAGEWDESVASLQSALRLLERLTKADERAGAAAGPIPAAAPKPGSRPIGWSPSVPSAGGPSRPPGLSVGR